MKQLRQRRTVVVLAIALIAVFGVLRAADHADAPNTSEGNLDVNDLYVFANGDNIVFAMTVSPLLAPGAATSGAAFNPKGLYQFKIDTDGDGIEDGVIQATFAGSGPGQRLKVRGPAVPTTTGATGNTLVGGGVINGPFNQTFSKNGMTVFAGPRDDPFFVHLFGDESLTSVLNAAFGVGAPQTLSFADPGVDDLAGLNVLALVVELSKTDLAGALGISATDAISVWATTSIKD